MNQPIASEERQDISEDLVNLVERAREGMQQEVNRSVFHPPVSDLIVLVLDGTSPLAGLAPPAIKAGGAGKIAAKLMDRASLIRGLRDIYPVLAEALTQPAICGHEEHLEFLATTAKGGVLLCCTCDEGMKPKASAKA